MGEIGFIDSAEEVIGSVILLLLIDMCATELTMDASKASYVDRNQVVEVVSALLKVLLKLQEDRMKKKKKKQPLLSVNTDDGKNLLKSNEKVELMITFKQTPPNRSTYINQFGPIPHPYHDVADHTTCLIVRDLNPKTPLKDRELDLQLTKDKYSKKLLESGLSEDFVNHRLFILPMRELLTEYRIHDLKNKLVKSYDTFLAERTLISNKNSLLSRFLGSPFWIKKKKFPIPVDTGEQKGSLRREIQSALSKVPLYITGHGPHSSMVVGYTNQSQDELVDNLLFCLQKINEKFADTVQILRLQSTKTPSIPFYADLSRPLGVWAKMPKAPEGRLKTVIDEHPFVGRAKIAVYPSGKTKILGKRIKPRKGIKSRPRRVINLRRQYVSSKGIKRKNGQLGSSKNVKKMKK